MAAPRRWKVFLVPNHSQRARLTLAATAVVTLLGTLTSVAPAAVAAPVIPVGKPTTPPPPPPLPVPGSGEELSQPGVRYKPKPGLAVPAPPAMTSLSYVVAEAETGRVLAANNAHVPSLPASTLKALAALTLLPKLDANKKVIAVDDDIRVDGTKAGMMPQSDYTVGQLFHALLLGSANDAAQALARVNGGIPQTVAEMNVKAKSLGAINTVAVTPSGLDGPGQRTTAYDLAVIGRAAAADPLYVQYATRKTFEFPGKAESNRRSFQISNHNKMLWNYDGTIGVKNGYTVAAGHTYVGAVKRGTRTLVISFLNSTTASWRQSATMLDWAFANADKVDEVGTLNNDATKPPPAPSAEAAPEAARTETMAHQSDDEQQTAGLSRVLLAALSAGLLAVAFFVARRRRTFHY